ncbi:hypothetical protein [Kineococcus arenarius]|uniref:hypothetical protein n=1 Tax=Kineococcus sp. SYSU DK007 TaxID=3383128 RepID=UPI003D7DE6F9
MTGVAPAPTAALHRKLRIDPGARVWVWPGAEDLRDVLRDPGGGYCADPSQADAALVAIADRAGLREALEEHLLALAGIEVVWLVYAKGNRTDVNRDSLWVELAAHQWRAVAQVAFDATRSALRIRPLRVGEAVRHG